MQKFIAFICDVVLLAVGVFVAMWIMMNFSPAHSAESHPWQITSENDGVTHMACTARRELADGVFATVRMPSDTGTLRITLEGVNFDTEDDQYGLYAIDGSEPQNIYVTRPGSWKSEIVVPLNDKNLFSQFRQGRILTLLVGVRKYSMDLSGSARMLASLKQCNADGQRLLNRKRMSDAGTARARA